MIDARAIGDNVFTSVSLRATTVEQLRQRQTALRTANYDETIARILLPSVRVDSDARDAVPEQGRPVTSPRLVTMRAETPARDVCGDPDPKGGGRHCRLTPSHITRHKTWGRLGSRSWNRRRA